MRTFVSVEEYRKAVQAFQNGGGTIVDAAPAQVGEFGELVAKVKAFANTPRAAERRTSSEAKDRMLAKAFRVDLEAQIRAAFHPKTYDALRLILHTSTNELVGVTSKLSALYDSAPKRYARLDVPAEVEAEAAQAAAEARAKSTDELDERPVIPDVEEPGEAFDPELEALLATLDLEGASTEEEGDGYERIAKVIDLDVTLQKVEKLTRAHPCVWLRPRVVYDVDATGAEVPESGRVSFIIYTPAHADVLVDPNDPTRALAWFYFSEELAAGKLQRVVNVFTETAFFRLDAEWKPIGSPEVNELGRLPVAKFEIDVPTNGYYVEGIGDDLHAATIELCVLKTLQNARAKDSSFKQLAIQGDPDKLPADQVMGGPSPIVLGDGNSATVLDLQPNLEAWTMLAKERAREVESSYGIVVDVEAAGAPESGYAKKLRMAAVLRENRRVRPHFQRGERDLFELLGRLLAVRPVPSLPPIPPGELVTDFAEVSIDENPKEQAAIDAIEIKSNTISVLDVLARKNPDLSEVELARLAWRNRRINEALIGSGGERLIDFLSLGGKSDGTQQGTNDGTGAPPSDPEGGAPGPR